MNPFVFFGLANAPAWLVGLGRRLGRVGLPARCKTARPFLRFVACVGYAARPLTRFCFLGVGLFPRLPAKSLEASNATSPPTTALTQRNAFTRILRPQISTNGVWLVHWYFCSPLKRLNAICGGRCRYNKCDCLLFLEASNVKRMIFSPQPPQMPPVLDRLRGLPVRHLVRMLSEWEQVRNNGNATDRLRALVQMRRIVSALDAALV